VAENLYQQNIEELASSLAKKIANDVKLAQDLNKNVAKEEQKPLIPTDFLMVQGQNLLKHGDTLREELSKVERDILLLKRDEVCLRRLKALDKLGKDAKTPWQRQLRGSEYLLEADDELLDQYQSVAPSLLDELLKIDDELDRISKECEVNFDHLSPYLQIAKAEKSPLKRTAAYNYLARDYSGYGHYLVNDYSAAHGHPDDEFKPGFYLYRKSDGEICIKIAAAVRHEDYSDDLKLSDFVPSELLEEVDWDALDSSSSDCVKTKFSKELEELIIDKCMSPLKKLTHPHTNSTTGRMINTNGGLVPIPRQLDKLKGKKLKLDSYINKYERATRYFLNRNNEIEYHLLSDLIKSYKNANMVGSPENSELSELQMIQLFLYVETGMETIENFSLDSLLIATFDMLKYKSGSGNITCKEALYLDLFSSISDYSQVIRRIKEVRDNATSNSVNKFEKNVDAFVQLAIAQKAITELQQKAVTLQARKLPKDFPEQNISEFEQTHYAESFDTFRNIYLTTAKQIRKESKDLLSHYLYEDLSELFKSEELSKVFDHHYHKRRAKLHNRLSLNDLVDYNVLVGSNPDELTVSYNPNTIFIDPMTDGSKYDKLDCKIYRYQFYAKVKNEFGEETLEPYTGYVQDPSLLAAVREHVAAVHDSGNCQGNKLRNAPTWLTHFKQQIVSDYTLHTQMPKIEVFKPWFWQIYRQNEQEEAKFRGHILAVVESSGSFDSKLNAINSIIRDAIPPWWKFWRSDEEPRYNLLLVNITIYLAVAELRYSNDRGKVFEYLGEVEGKIKGKILPDIQLKYEGYVEVLKDRYMNEEEPVPGSSSQFISCRAGQSSTVSSFSFNHAVTT
jgi:hypothetical protein